VAISVESLVVRPDVPERASHNLLVWLGLLVVIVSAAIVISGISNQRELRAFVGSNLFLRSLLVSGSAAIFPVMLHSTLDPQNSLTAYTVAANSRALALASVWWPIGFGLAVAYFIFISRRYAGKVSVSRDNQGFY
jgi:cytochrome d ubiquinol oxidase subunit II